MATGKASDFKIYQDQLIGGMVETLVQQTELFNASSRNAIVLRDHRMRGDYGYESFFKNISDLVSRRDTSSTASATDLALSQEEFISVKIDRKVGPVGQTLDSFRKIMRQSNEQSLSFLIGTQVAKGMMVDKLNTGLRAAKAALDNVSDLTVDVSTTGDGKISSDALVQALAKMGDAADRVVCWVMHSKVYYDLVRDQIADNIDGVSNFNLASARPITLNRPVLVTDSTALTAAVSPTADGSDYFTLGLTAEGILVETSEDEIMHAEIVTGLENLVCRLQGEFAYNLGLKGFKWDVSSGGANPTDAAIGTGSNWDQAVTSYKDCAGVVLQTR
jgi:hypothetical protein